MKQMLLSMFETKELIMNESGMCEKQWAMHMKSVTKCLFRLRTAFPVQSRNFDEIETEALTALWLEFFADIKPEILESAVNLYIKRNRTGFFPSLGQIVGFVEQIMAEGEARQQAIKNQERTSRFLQRLKEMDGHD